MYADDHLLPADVVKFRHPSYVDVRMGLVLEARSRDQLCSVEYTLYVLPEAEGEPAVAIVTPDQICAGTCEDGFPPNECAASCRGDEYILPIRLGYDVGFANPDYDPGFSPVYTVYALRVDQVPAKNSRLVGNEDRWRLTASVFRQRTEAVAILAWRGSLAYHNAHSSLCSVIATNPSFYAARSKLIDRKAPSFSTDLDANSWTLFEHAT